MPLQKLQDFTSKIADLPDRPSETMTANELKQYFDGSAEEVRVALNAVIDVLQSTTDDSGAKNISTKSIAGLAGNDVQTLLQSLKTLSDDNRAYLLSQIQGIVIGQIPDGSITEAKLAEDVIAILNDYLAHKIDKAHVHWLGNAGGTADALTFTYPTITEYKDGLGVSFAVTADSTAATSVKIGNLTTIPVLKANGSPVSNLKKDGIYTARFSVAKTAFIVQGEGGEYGTSQAHDVRLGKTFGTDDGIKNGSLDLTNLLNTNIKKGVNIGGVLGNLDPEQFAFGIANISFEFSSQYGSNMRKFIVNGLNFTPVGFIVVQFKDTNTMYDAQLIVHNVTGLSNGYYRGTNIDALKELSLSYGGFRFTQQWGASGSTPTNAQFFYFARRF